MDANKNKKLEEVGYEIAACAMCEHGQFDGESKWGTCGLFTYEHLKHTDATRQLSVHAMGNCPSFTLFERVTAENINRPFSALGPFAKFVRGRKDA